MDDDRTLGNLGIAAAVFCGLSILLFGLAIGFDPLAGAELVERIVEVDPADADWIKWGAVTDIVGYYFLPLVLMILLRRRMERSSLADLAIVGGAAYAVVGAAGAAILAAAAPTLIEQRNAAELENLVRIVQGMWQWFEPIPFALWTVGMASALRRTDPLVARAFALLTVGAAAVLAGHLIEKEIVLAIGLTIWLGLLPVILATTGIWSRDPLTREAR